MRPHPKAKGNPYQRKLFCRRVLEQGWSVGEVSEGSTLLQGGEYGRGWSVVIQRDTGEMSGAIAGDEGAIVLLGACTGD